MWVLQGSRIARLIAAVAIVGCGGGSGGDRSSTDSGVPLIVASVATFPALSIPGPVLSNGGTTLVVVSIVDAGSRAQIADANVEVNGASMAYVQALQVYRAWLEVSTADSVSVVVTWRGASYAVTGSVAPTYPQILSPRPQGNFPTDSAVFPDVMRSRPVYVSWVGDLPGSGYRYALAILDERGELIWPSTTSFQFLDDPSSRAASVPGDSVPAGFPYIAVGISKTVTVPEAAPGSNLTMAGFSPSWVFARDSNPATLESLSISPRYVSLAVGQRLQLNATAHFVQNAIPAGVQDYTDQVVWKSSRPDVLTVSPTGVVRALSAGTATVAVQLGATSTTVNARVVSFGSGPAAGDVDTLSINAAHNGVVIPVDMSGPTTFPSSPLWQATLPNTVSFPLIAGTQVFVLASDGQSSTDGVSLHAFDAETGIPTWGPVSIASAGWLAGFAHDGGRIFTVNGDCVVEGIEAATGKLLWTTRLADRLDKVWVCQHAPTAARGLVYVNGAGVDGTISALDGATGEVLWATYLLGATDTTPTITNDGVYVTYLHQAYKLAPSSGAILWRYSGPGFGGGAHVAPVYQGKLYMRDPDRAQNLVFDAATGITVGTFDSTGLPGFHGDAALLLKDGVLTASDIRTGATLWTFSADGQLISSPVTAGNVVVIGARNGVVYALDAASGAQLWHSTAGTTLIDPVSNLQPGLAIGRNLLVVPAGNVLTVFRWPGG